MMTDLQAHFGIRPCRKRSDSFHTGEAKVYVLVEQGGSPTTNPLGPPSNPRALHGAPLVSTEEAPPHAPWPSFILRHGALVLPWGEERGVFGVSESV
jgi:hypothetical protein